MKRHPFPLLLFAPFIYLTICLFAAGLLAYPLHFIVPDTLVGFHTLVSRGAEILLVLGLFPMGRRLGVGKPEMGTALPKTRFKNGWAMGFGCGALMLGLHTLLLIAIDVRMINHDKLEALRVMSMAAKGLLIGIAVSSVEEPVFRGFLLGSLADRTSRFNAVLISSVYFAALHFLSSDLRPSSSEVQWNSGIIIIFDAFSKFRHVELNSFLTLLIAGFFLSCIRLLNFREGLPLCIGIHAGWVFIIKTAKPFTYRNTDSSLSWLVSNFDGFIGYLSSAWMSFLIMGLIWLIVRSPDQTRASRQ